MIRRLCGLLALGGMACQVAPDSIVPDSPTVADTGARTEVEPPPASLEPGEVEAAMIQALSGGLPRPKEAVDAFGRILIAGDDGRCPNSGGYTITESFTGCHSEKGYIYAGLTIYTDSTNDDFSFLGDCYVIDPDGDIFQAAGELEQATDPADHSFAIKLTGTWGYAKEEGWLSSVPSLALWLEGDADHLVANGGWSTPAAILYFEGFQSGSSCAHAGLLKLQDPQGAWYTLDYGADCDACGALSYAGQAMGEICVPVEEAATAYREEFSL
ncbi:MAG TPA: hypothetical protein PLA94_11570 [Myxococcota bacterium]|nr:hypothetical protein [Myxococcota bacterium]